MQATPLKGTAIVAAFAFGGQSFHIADKTALHWPTQSALLVADLHLEKGSWFAERGQMLPPYDSMATLDRVARIAAECGVSSVWALGDNFHDDTGPSRMADPVRERLAALTARYDWHWITGNHDDGLAGEIGGTIHEEASLDGIALRHIADPLARKPELSGHWHPKVTVETRTRRLRRPCFIRSQTKLILPAFGAYTGGMAADDPSILSRTGPGSEALIESGGVVRGFLLGRS